MAFPLVFSPGRVNLGLAGFGVANGFRRSLPYLAGILLGMVFVLLMVALGITTLILSEPVGVRALMVLAVDFFLYLAWSIALTPIAARSATSAM